MIIFFIISLLANLLFIYLFISERKEFVKLLSPLNSRSYFSYNQRLKTRSLHSNVLFVQRIVNELLREFEKKKEKLNYLEGFKIKSINNISHDIRTPLSSIIGYAEMLQQTAATKDAYNHLEVIIKKGYLIEDLVNSFSGYTYLEFHAKSLNKDTHNMIEIIEDEILAYYQEFEKANIHPNLNFCKKEIFVKVDEIAWKRVFTNLLSNFFRYGSSNGQFGINVEENENKITIEFWDNGYGIEETDLPYIFERNYIAEPSRNKEYHGKGLGLAVCKNLIELHNGTITVMSKKNIKTSFFIQLPKM